MNVEVTVRYFAMLREQAGKNAETLLRPAQETLASLYDFLRVQYDFSLASDELRVAVNGDFSQFDRTIAPNDEIVFIPPVAGG